MESFAKAIHERPCDWVNPAIGSGAANVTMVPHVPKYPTLEKTYADSQVYHMGGALAAFIPGRPSSDIFTPSNGSWPSRSLQLPDSWKSPVAYNITKHLLPGTTFDYAGSGAGPVKDKFTVVCICENDELCGCGTEAWNDEKDYAALRSLVEVEEGVWAINGSASWYQSMVEAQVKLMVTIEDERRRKAGECQGDNNALLEDLEWRFRYDVDGGAERWGVGWTMALVGLAVGWVV